MTDPLKDLQILLDKYIKVAAIAQTVCDDWDADYYNCDLNIPRLKEALEELKDAR